MPKTPMTQIQRAVALFGNQQGAANAFGVNPALVSQWVRNLRPVAAHHCIAIENATGGKVTRHELRADVFGPAPAKKKAA